MKTATVRLQVASQQDGDEVVAFLQAALGAAVALAPPHGGWRGTDVWFVRGLITFDAPRAAESRRLVEAVIRETGQVILVHEPVEEEVAAPDPSAARRIGRLSRLGEREPEPDGEDRHELHKRLREQKDGQT